MRAVSSIIASSSKCFFSRSIKSSSIAPECNVTASAYSSAIRSDSLKRSLCCQTSSACTLANATPRLRSVAEFMSTQKRQPLSCETRTVISERKTGGNGEVLRSIIPLEKRDSKKEFWRARPKPRRVEHCSILTPLVPKERPQIPRVTFKRFRRNSHELILKFSNLISSSEAAR